MRCDVKRLAATVRLPALMQNTLLHQVLRVGSEHLTVGQALVWLASWHLGRHLSPEMLRAVLDYAAEYVVRFGDQLASDWLTAAENPQGPCRLPVCRIGLVDWQLCSVEGMPTLLSLQTGEPLSEVPASVLQQATETYTLNLTSLFFQHRELFEVGHVRQGFPESGSPEPAQLCDDLAGPDV